MMLASSKHDHYFHNKFELFSLYALSSIPCFLVHKHDGQLIEFECLKIPCCNRDLKQAYSRLVFIALALCVIGVERHINVGGYQSP